MIRPLYKSLEKKSLRCLACRHYCKIAPGNTGICGVRINENGKLKLLVYGKAAAVNIDPVEKKPLFHFLPGSSIFSLGTVGCNFGCEFCQNWDISQASKDLKERLAKKGKLMDLEAEISKLGYDLPPEKIVQYCIDHKIPSIAYTYNEPGIFFEYTYDTAKLAHEKGIKNVYVSNGYSSEEAADKIAPYLDAANIDLKAFTENFYAKVCKAKLSAVLKSIEYFYKKNIWIELTTLLIPGKNDSDEEVTKIAKFIADINKNIPWHITGFTPQYKMWDVPETSDGRLSKAWEIGKEEGLNFVYVGNTFNPERQSTFCPKCSELLIERDWGYIGSGDINGGNCGNCGYSLPGIFK